MNRILRRAVLAVSSLGVAGGIAMTALPASAGPLPPIHSWGAEAMGPASFPPVAYATPGHTPAVASNANYTNFLTTGMILDRASTSTAYSRVNSPLVNLSFLQATIQADQITSYCHIGRRGTYGGASIFSGSVSQTGEGSYNPLTNPAPNTKVSGGGFTVIFNKQVIVKGQLQVTAIYVQSGPERLYLGVSQCNADDDVVS